MPWRGCQTGEMGAGHRDAARRLLDRERAVASITTGAAVDPVTPAGAGAVHADAQRFDRLVRAQRELAGGEVGALAHLVVEGQHGAHRHGREGDGAHGERRVEVPLARHLVGVEVAPGDLLDLAVRRGGRGAELSHLAVLVERDRVGGPAREVARVVEPHPQVGPLGDAVGADFDVDRLLQDGGGGERGGQEGQCGEEPKGLQGLQGPQRSVLVFVRVSTAGPEPASEHHSSPLRRTGCGPLRTPGTCRSAAG